MVGVGWGGEGRGTYGWWRDMVGEVALELWSGVGGGGGGGLDGGCSCARCESGAVRGSPAREGKRDCVRLRASRLRAYVWRSLECPGSSSRRHG